MRSEESTHALKVSRKKDRENGGKKCGHADRVGNVFALARAAVACVPSALKSNDRGRRDVNVPVSGLSKLLAGRRVTSVLLRVDAEKIEH